MTEFCGHGLVCVRSERVVFSGLDFVVAPHDALVLRGANGSGKSSLLRVMAGLLPLHGGAMTWDGEPISRQPETHRARLHYVGHHDALKAVLTVEENLAFWAAVHGPGSGVQERVRQALAAFDLANLASVPAGFLSAGQRRRLNLARVLASPASLWLLDEPATALDDASVQRLQQVLATHREQGGRVVLSAHGVMDLPDSRVLNLDHYAAPWPTLSGDEVAS